MSIWDGFDREERAEAAKVTGRVRCVIVDAEETVSKSGYPMFVITVRPSGTSFKVKTWIVKNDVHKFNQNLTRFYDAFPEILFGERNLMAWVGAEGAAMFGVNDNGYMEVRYFIDAADATDLPAFEGEKPERQTITTLDDAEDDDLPFEI